MGLQVCVLASGSSGNCIYVGNEDTRLLIDAGVSCKIICDRLAEIGVVPSSVQGVCITHEHTDHHAGLPVFYRKFGVPVFGNAGTVEVLGRSAKHSGIHWNIFTTGQPFRVGSLVVEPFLIPHDSFEPVAFTVRSGDIRIGVCTDLGVATDLVKARLRHCDLIVLETNHDEDLLLSSDRSWPLKQRIAGHKGHLSNRKAAALLSDVGCERLKAVFLAHVSQDCNRPQLAEDTVRTALSRVGLGHVDLHLTYPDRASALWQYPVVVESGKPPIAVDDLQVDKVLMDVGT